MVRKFMKKADLFEPTSKVLDGENLTGVKGFGLVIAIPKSVAKALKLKPGDQIVWIDYDPKTGIARVKKSL